MNGKWVRKLPNGATVAADLGEMVYENRSAYLQMKILAGLWVGNYCGTVIWPTSGSTGGGGGGSGWGDYTLVCNYEWWEVSYDGGATWHRTEVRVCDYQWQWHVTYRTPSRKYQLKPSDPLGQNEPAISWLERILA